MNWKNRLTNYNFWISIVSAILLILQALKIEFDIAYINEIATAVLGLLVVIGIISDPTKYMSKDNYVNKNQSKEEKIQSNENVQETKNINIEKGEEENSMPIGNEDKVNIGTVQTDYENLISTISNDLKEELSMKSIIETLVQVVENLKPKVEEDKVLESIEQVLEKDEILKENEICEEVDEKKEESTVLLEQNFNNIVN